MPEIILIAHNIRSTHNVGSIFRTADGFGVKSIIISGYTPYPKTPHDSRLPHIADKLSRQIHKTALGAEQTVPFDYQAIPDITGLKAKGYRVVALEQTVYSLPIRTYHASTKIALLLGEEVAGIEASLLALCDETIEIPMVGRKESFNVSVAAGIALYQLTM